MEKTYFVLSNNNKLQEHCMSDYSGSALKKATPAKEAPKKLHRIIIRKLPVRGFTLDDFNTCIDRVCRELNLSKDFFLVEHFIEGKIR